MIQRLTKTPLIAGFTGTQQEDIPNEQFDAFCALLKALKPVVELHHGDCIGWDKKAHTYFDRKTKRIVIHPPSNPNKRAFCRVKEASLFTRPEKDYLPRNHDIDDEAMFLIACPKELTTEELRSGTWATVRYMRKLEKPVFIIRPDGRIQEERIERLDF